MTAMRRNVSMLDFGGPIRRHDTQQEQWDYVEPKRRNEINSSLVGRFVCWVKKKVRRLETMKDSGVGCSNLDLCWPRLMKLNWVQVPRSKQDEVDLTRKSIKMRLQCSPYRVFSSLSVCRLLAFHQKMTRHEEVHPHATTIEELLAPLPWIERCIYFFFSSDIPTLEAMALLGANIL